MNTAGIVVLVIVLLLLVGGIGWVFFARQRAERLGLPPPALASFIPFYTPRPSYGVQPAPGGVVGWFNDHFRGMKSRNRTAVGAYEGAGAANAAGAGRSRGGFGPLDPDDAWDTRVGNEADAYYYNEEQELGLHGQRSRVDVSSGASPYLHNNQMGGSSYDMNVAADVDGAGSGEQRGRTRGRSPLGGGEAGPGPSGGSTLNPFDDDVADSTNASLRGVSPRPMVEATAAAKSN